jgi:hypothetical protein
MSSKRVSQKIAKKTLKLRTQLWPKITEDMLWDRTKKKGFTTIPRTMPYFLQLMDDLSSGKPVSSTYMVLWCRTFDENMVTIANPREWAFESGFSGQRAELTWRTRMKRLEELGFIQTQPGPSGQYHYVLILNPYLVIKKLVDGGEQLRPDRYNALVQRANDIGAEELL